MIVIRRTRMVKLVIEYVQFYLISIVKIKKNKKKMSPIIVLNLIVVNL